MLSPHAYPGVENFALLVLLRDYYSINASLLRSARGGSFLLALSFIVYARRRHFSIDSGDSA